LSPRPSPSSTSPLSRRRGRCSTTTSSSARKRCRRRTTSSSGRRHAQSGSHSSDRAGAQARPLLQPLPRPVQCVRPSGILVKLRHRHRALGSTTTAPRVMCVDSGTRLDPVCTHTASQVVVQERLLRWLLLRALCPYQPPPHHSGGVVIREGHASSSSAPPCMKKEAPHMKEGGGQG
jgi:hypothetical protein